MFKNLLDSDVEDKDIAIAIWGWLKNWNNSLLRRSNSKALNRTGIN